MAALTSKANLRWLASYELALTIHSRWQTNTDKYKPNSYVSPSSLSASFVARRQQVVWLAKYQRVAYFSNEMVATASKKERPARVGMKSAKLTSGQ